MPRQARIDVPGQVYHVMSRGIERGSIFLGEDDYVDFRERIGVWLNKSGAKCLAWCLMPNHFHFLVLRGERPLSELMHHAMTGYAINFNLRHRRAGHLFQNRYKAIICDLEEYFMEVVPYIHLNPLRANLVEDLDGLAAYKWCGHCAAISGVEDGILNRDSLLWHLGDSEGAAVARYMQVMREKAEEMRQKDLSGGGLLRSLGGEGAVLRAMRAGEKVLSDQRILGEGDFVAAVLRTAGEAMQKAKKSRAEVLGEVAAATGISREDILRRTRERGPASARAIYCYLCREAAGGSAVELTGELGITQSAVSKLASKGRILAERMKIVI
ncbi:MAG: transposase [Elusimicrobia bacterium HGW-Elusimicrobia-3]|jgi:REP element-mobilizing transposase RayT|nr:MAG: transposase [Elusimicrobia bacterium HGW-Elusimicrobia-3]